MNVAFHGDAQCREYVNCLSATGGGWNPSGCSGMPLLVITRKENDDQRNSTDQGGVLVDSHGKGAGKGALVKWEHAPCMAAAQDTTLFVFTKENDECTRPICSTRSEATR